MKERIRLDLTVPEAEALHRVIRHAQGRGVEGKDGLCFGDKRKVARIEDQLFESVTMSDEFNARPAAGRRGLRVRRPAIFED